MRFFIYIILVIISFILQTTLFNYIEIYDIKPNLLLILTISFAFMRDEIDGGIIGLLCGFLSDSFFSSILGVNMFIGVILGFLCGKISIGFNKDSFSIPFILIFIFNILNNLLFFFFNIFLRGNFNILIFIKAILIESTYTALVAIVFYRVFYSINLRLLKYDRKNKNLFKN